MVDAVRLSKLMAQRGICSRREADRYIKDGHVLVDGKVVDVLGTKIFPDQEIALDRKAANKQAALCTVLLNKPSGYVSGLPEKGYQSAVMLITPENRRHAHQQTPGRQGLAPAGRLDIDSTGLIVFTQDGRLARRLISPHSEIEKEYQVKVEGLISREKLDTLRHGLSLDNRTLKPANVTEIGEGLLKFILKEGRKRQIRRMCDLVDLRVVRLKRIRIGMIGLGDLQAGQWRLLKQGEVF